MMMADDGKKKLATIIVSKMAPKPESEKPESEEGPSEHEVAAEEAMAAIQAKDAKALAEALKSFVEMCKYSEEDESEESEESES